MFQNVGRLYKERDGGPIVSVIGVAGMGLAWFNSESMLMNTLV